MERRCVRLLTSTRNSSRNRSVRSADRPSSPDAMDLAFRALFRVCHARSRHPKLFRTPTCSTRLTSARRTGIRLVAGGVTTVFVSSDSAAVIGPRGAVVKTSGSPRTRILEDASDVQATMGSDSLPRRGRQPAAVPRVCFDPYASAQLPHGRVLGLSQGVLRHVGRTQRTGADRVRTSRSPKHVRCSIRSLTAR